MGRRECSFDTGVKDKHSFELSPKEVGVDSIQYFSVDGYLTANGYRYFYIEVYDQSPSSSTIEGKITVRFRYNIDVTKLNYLNEAPNQFYHYGVLGVKSNYMEKTEIYSPYYLFDFNYTQTCLVEICYIDNYDKNMDYTWKKKERIIKNLNCLPKEYYIWKSTTYS